MTGKFHASFCAMRHMACFISAYRDLINMTERQKKTSSWILSITVLGIGLGFALPASAAEGEKPVFLQVQEGTTFRVPSPDKSDGDKPVLEIGGSLPPKTVIEVRPQDIQQPIEATPTLAPEPLAEKPSRLFIKDVKVHYNPKLDPTEPNLSPDEVKKREEAFSELEKNDIYISVEALNEKKVAEVVPPPPVVPVLQIRGGPPHEMDSGYEYLKDPTLKFQDNSLRLEFPTPDQNALPTWYTDDAKSILQLVEHSLENQGINLEGESDPEAVTWDDSFPEIIRVADQMSETLEQYGDDTLMTYLESIREKFPVGYPISCDTPSQVNDLFQPPWRKHHDGFDIKAAKGSPVHATGGGTVSVVGYNPSGYSDYGKIVVIDHGNNLETIYAHLDTIKVKKGDIITTETIVGTLGNTGRSSGAHLHYEVRKNGVAVNPLEYFAHPPQIDMGEMVKKKPNFAKKN